MMQNVILVVLSILCMIGTVMIDNSRYKDNERMRKEKEEKKED